MTKVLECKSVVPGCEFVMHGDSEEEVMIKAIVHAHNVHGVEHMSEALRAKVRASIHDQAKTR